jgi:hypothetical protein
MIDPHLKRLPLIVALILAILGGSLYLIARPMSPAPVPPALPAKPAITPSPAQTRSTTSTQPKITWSQNQVEVILAPTESTSRDLTFSSSLDLQNVVIEAVPEIAGFLTIQPNAFASVPASQAQSGHVSFSIPTGTMFGTYDGTIHLRVGSTTFPQTLKVIVDVWQPYENAAFGIRFLMPPGMVAEASNDGQGSLIYVHDGAEEFPNGLAVRRHNRDLTSVLSDIIATLRIASENQQTINGQTWTIYDFVDPTGGPEFIDAFTTVNGVVYQVGGKALSVSSILQNFLTTIAFN